MSSNVAHNLINFNIDNYLNPFVPRNQLRHVPPAISHFLGYRKTPSKEPPIVLQWLLTVVATVAGLCVAGAVFNYAPGITKWHPPVAIASLGASAVLDYNAIRSPLSQPRNTIVGHTLSAIVGVGVAKLFQLNSDFEHLQWLSGALGCAAATLVMSVTNSVHPPGGATAVLASTQQQIIALGWMFPPITLLACLLMTAVACLLNNTLRQYPVYWWSPEDTGSKLRSNRDPGVKDVEKHIGGSDLAAVPSGQTLASERTLAHKLSDSVDFVDGSDEMHIMPYKIKLPSHIALSGDEVSLLEHLQERLRTHAEVN